MAGRIHTLFGSRGSGSASTEMALRACGIDYRIVDAATWEPESALGELRKVNPLQQIPTLVLPDKTVLTESAAILIHLGLTAPPGLLLPRDASARAQNIRGLVYIPANCYAAISVIDYPGRWTTATTKPSLDKIRAGTRARLHRSWEIFADTVEPAGRFFNGDEPGALDFLAVVVSKWAGTRAHLKAHRGKFATLLQRIEKHERVAPVLHEHWPPSPA